jgi:hypothetical protein
MRAIFAAALLAGVATLTGCSDDSGPDSYPAPGQTVREHEEALPGKTVKIGEVDYTAIGLQTDIFSVTGSHADVPAKGRYARVRLMMTNRGRDRHDLDLNKQLLVTRDGRTYTISFDAMQVARGPATPFTIARDEVRSFDLWYDIPVGAKVRALRITGDASSSKLSDQLSGKQLGPATKDLSLDD